MRFIYSSYPSRLIEIAKEPFRKLSRILRNGKNTLETWKRLLNSYGISALLWKISSRMESRHEATEMCLYGRILMIP